jgi:hypothetical protein
MENKKYALNLEKVLFTPLEDDGVLYVIDENKYISLNETYALIIKYVSAEHKFQFILEHLISTYDVDREVCKLQLETVLTELIAKKYIVESIG